jgi:hypothetical protein
VDVGTGMVEDVGMVVDVDVDGGDVVVVVEPDVDGMDVVVGVGEGAPVLLAAVAVLGVKVVVAAYAAITPTIAMTARKPVKVARRFAFR